MANGSPSGAGLKILQIVQGMLAKRSIYDAVEAGANLRDLGLTSLDMVNLMLAVEDEFGIELPTSAMTPENFRSVVSIEALISRTALAA